MGNGKWGMENGELLRPRGKNKKNKSAIQKKTPARIGRSLLIGVHLLFISSLDAGGIRERILKILFGASKSGAAWILKDNPETRFFKKTGFLKFRSPDALILFDRCF